MNELNSISTPSPVQESSSELSSGLPDFTQLGLSQSILRAVQEQGYTHPTPIQAQAIPHVLTGKDVMGAAQTGTGKTAAFVLPIPVSYTHLTLPTILRV